MRKYLPEVEEGGRFPERDFIFGILSTIYPEYVEEIVTQALDLRNTKENKEPEELIELDDEFFNLIQKSPFISSKIS